MDNPAGERLPEAVEAAAGIHPTALCAATRIGAGSHVQAFAAIASDCIVGENCAVAEHAVLGPGVVLEDGVRAGTGARILSGTRVERGTVIGENAVLGATGSSACDIGPNVVIGASATILPGVTVSRGAVVQAGSVVADVVPANAIVRGNPARIVGYVGGESDAAATPVAPSHAVAPKQTAVAGVRTERVTVTEDLRGSLMAAEFSQLPFKPVRLFSVFGVPGEHIRGSHAHRSCSQFLMCVAGSLSCVIDDGTARDEILLDTPGIGLYLPPMIWGTQYKYSSDAVLLVLASDPYDPDDYIRDYDEFLELVAARSSL